MPRKNTLWERLQPTTNLTHMMRYVQDWTIMRFKFLMKLQHNNAPALGWSHVSRSTWQSHTDCKPFYYATSINWRLRWKKGVRVFTQKWTLSKTLQISHAVLFTCVKQCSACFFPWSLLSFLNITYAKKHIFPRAFSGDLLLNEKQKKPFVSLSDEVTIIASFPYYCSVSTSG